MRTTRPAALLVTCALAIPARVASATPSDATAPIAAFLEIRVADELSADGLVLSRLGLALQIEPLGDALLLSLIDLTTGRVVSSTRLDNLPRDREAAVASVTQIAADLITKYTGTPTSPPLAGAAPPSSPPPPLSQPSPPALQPSPPALQPLPPPVQPLPPPVQPLPPPAEPTVTSERTGLTFELGVGTGFQHLSSWNTDLSYAFALGIGAWIIPGRVAVTVRAVVVGMSPDNLTYKAAAPNLVLAEELFSAYVGPSVQYWLDDHVWIAGGLGFATVRTNGVDSVLDLKSPCYYSTNATCDVNGVAADLRAGYSIGPSAHQLNVSVELIPGTYGTDPGQAIHGEVGHSGSALSVALLAGYQFL